MKKEAILLVVASFLFFGCAMASPLPSSFNNDDENYEERTDNYVRSPIDDWESKKSRWSKADERTELSWDVNLTGTADRVHLVEKAIRNEYSSQGEIRTRKVIKNIGQAVYMEVNGRGEKIPFSNDLLGKLQSLENRNMDITLRDFCDDQEWVMVNLMNRPKQELVEIGSPESSLPSERAKEKLKEKVVVRQPVIAQPPPVFVQSPPIVVAPLVPCVPVYPFYGYGNVGIYIDGGYHYNYPWHHHWRYYDHRYHKHYHYRKDYNDRGNHGGHYKQ